MRVSFDDGKYTFIVDEVTGVISEVLRHGEAWPAADDLRHMKVVGAMLHEIIEHRKRNTAEFVASDGTTRKAHYTLNDRGEQVWDTTLRLGWGPVAAAFCVLRYLRRDKDAEHSRKSARWYFARLNELCEGVSASHLRAEARYTMTVLLSELRPEEVDRLKG